jgi:polyhydroxybutyrate depolymerase
MPRITALRLGLLLISLITLVQITPTHAQVSTICRTVDTNNTVGLSDEKLTFGGLQRHYLLYIPDTYDPLQATPLVFSIHGFASNPEQQREFSNWDAIADKEPLIVVYPQGTGFPSRWNAGNSSFIGKLTVDDVGFLRQIVATISESVCIDPTRIYTSGLSNGGGMSNRLACESSDMIAAMGGVAGAYSATDCYPKFPVSVIAFHGTSDPIVDYHGNTDQNVPDIQVWAAAWAERDHCAMKPESIAATGDASGIRYRGCINNAEVVLYTIDGGGHTWPGSSLKLDFLGKTSMDIDATAVMWEFFKQHRMQ